MAYKIIFQDLKDIDYKEAWDYQEKCFRQVMDFKQDRSKTLPEKAEGYLLFCEHPHVYTLGKSGEQNNLLISDEFLKSINATYYKIDRGGDITYHGPGQIVGYPIIDLERFGLGLKKYIESLEEAIIAVVAEYGIEAGRLKGATGVWLDADKPNKARKMCAIGVRASRFVTMHGFAFNVNTQLDYFNHINPCGFVDKGVTSMEKELGHKMDYQQVQQKTKKHLGRVFGMQFLDI
ncbi:MAG: lipoyl(octanoyl) transferase LipB [Bacteroidales bacterium]|nr:lipoyl(octanoyl) transferase LipB [Bacteroidales bacterium]